MGSWLLLANRPIQNKPPGFSYQYSQSTCLCRSKTLPNQHTSMNKNYLCMIYAVTKRHAQKTSYNIIQLEQGPTGRPQTRRPDRTEPGPGRERGSHAENDRKNFWTYEKFPWRYKTFGCSKSFFLTSFTKILSSVRNPIMAFLLLSTSHISCN